MILQALKEYYDRKPDLPREGYVSQAIKYVIVIDGDGNIKNIEDTTENKQSKSFVIPQANKKGLAFGWGNTKYTLGIGKNPTRQHNLFKDKINSLGEIEDTGLISLKLFLNKDDKLTLLSSANIDNEVIEEFKEKSPSTVFKLYGERDVIVNSDKIRNIIDNLKKKNNGQICLITGQKDSIAITHQNIKGVLGCKSTGANIVSFQVNSGYDSYGKEQGYNAPCGEKAVSAYTLALNYLLKSNQKMRIGDATTVFWAAKENNLENNFASFFNMSPKDNPDIGTNAVKALLKSVEDGALNNGDGKTEFYVLGLSPNAARIAVRFFIKDTVKGMSENIAKHFQDLEIDRPSFESEFLPLFKLLVSTAVLGKSENIAPHLAGDFMMSVLKGLPYPVMLLQTVINRIKAEQKITYPRAALIKAYLNRLSRKTQKEEITVSLNKGNANQGYVLGRLFATLEKLQEEAQGETNSTIMRYYGTASSSPVAVFSTLMKLHQHHRNKLSKEKVGRAVYFEKLIGEIQDKIDNSKGYPSYLSLTEQGMFSVGYYQQRQDFFKTKEEKIETENKIQGE